MNTLQLFFRASASVGATVAALAGAPAATAPRASGSAAAPTILRAELDEATVRNLIRKAAPGAAFVIPPGASWVLTATLDVPPEVTITGASSGSTKNTTFIKGFDGPLVRISSFDTLQGLVLDGNRGKFKGPGLVAGGRKKDRGVRECMLTHIVVRNHEGSGYVMASPTYYSQYNFCKFDHNGGYAVEYGEVRSHHTDNWYQNCHYGWNDRGGIAFHGVEVDSIWDNCEWFHNGGPCFEHFTITKKLAAGGEMGERPAEGAEVLQIRSCIFRNSAGPVWLHRGGDSESVVFQDCRMKHNGDPAGSDRTRRSGQTVEQRFGLTPPVAGMVHVEGGRIAVEFRGGFAYDGGAYLFTVGPKAQEGCQILISGSATTGFHGSIHNPRGYATILDRSLLPEDAIINVKSGIALDPRKGVTQALGPDNTMPTAKKKPPGD